MIDPALQQEAEGIRPRAIWWVGIGVVAISAVLVAIAWWLVVPPSALEPAARASTLEHGLIEGASGGADLRTAGEQALERTVWVDRKAGLVRIPIERAIDAVVANPKLIRAHPAAVLDAHADSAPRAANMDRPSPAANAPLTANPPSTSADVGARSATANAGSGNGQVVSPSTTANPGSTNAHAPAPAPTPRSSNVSAPSPAPTPRSTPGEVAQ